MATNTLEATLKTSDYFPNNFEVNDKIMDYYRNAKENYIKKYTKSKCSYNESVDFVCCLNIMVNIYAFLFL